MPIIFKNERMPFPQIQANTGRQIPVEEMIQILSQSPKAKAIEVAGQVIGQALANRAERRKNAGYSDAIQQFAKTGELPKGTNLPPEMLEKAANLYKALHPPQTQPIGFDEAGNPVMLPMFPPNTKGQVIEKPNQTITLEQKHYQWKEQMWQKVVDHVNQLNASSRKALGQAGNNNMRAQRLLVTAQNPNATPQDIALMNADLQYIYKGGVPDETMLKYGNYRSILQNTANALTYVTGNPQSAHSPEVIQHLVNISNELKKVDNDVIDDNLGIVGVGAEGIRKEEPERWQRLINAVDKSKRSGLNLIKQTDEFTDEKRKRLEELRAKKAAGALGK